MLLEGVEENGKLEDEEGDDRSIESTNEWNAQFIHAAS
jgi:hypothetical protein